MTEKLEAKRDGATLQANSGRGRFAKGDATTEDWCIDYKEYPKGFTVNITNWGKVCTDAQKAGGLEPTLKIVLGTGQAKTRLFVISETMFHEMNQAYKEKNEQLREV